MDDHWKRLRDTVHLWIQKCKAKHELQIPNDEYLAPAPPRDLVIQAHNGAIRAIHAVPRSVSKLAALTQALITLSSS
jgi:hypothetical protein